MCGTGTEIILLHSVNYLNNAFSYLCTLKLNLPAMTPRSGRWIPLVTVLKYGNTNTYFVRGDGAGLLCDTDYSGTLGAFFREIKAHGVKLTDISYVMATHYHPDHAGLIGELMRLGVKLLLIDVQRECVHFPDAIFERDKHIRYEPVNESDAVVISCEESRDFLSSLGIAGEIISVPSHSADSVALILDGDCADGGRSDDECPDGNCHDGGCCIAGDLEPFDYIGAYDDNPVLRSDWERILSFKPGTVYYAHANPRRFS